MELLREQWNEAMVTYLLNICTGISTLAIGWVVARLLRRALKRILKGARVDPTAAAFFSNLAYVALLVLLVITALHNLGVPTISFAAVVGAAGLAIGLALKGTLSNFASGILLIALRPFKVGDRIEGAGVKGVVTEIRVFATTVAADEGKRIFVPNAALTNGNITNYTAAP